MTETANDKPIGVHVTGSDVALGGGRRKGRRTIFITRNITAAEPTIQLLNFNATRLYVLMQAGGYNCVIATDKGTAQNAANQTAGQPNPIGLVLTAGNTGMTKIEGTSELWATAAQYPAQITMAVCFEET